MNQLLIGGAGGVSLFVLGFMAGWFGRRYVMRGKAKRVRLGWAAKGGKPRRQEPIT